MRESAFMQDNVLTPTTVSISPEAQPFAFRAEFQKAPFDIALGEFWMKRLSELPDLLAQKTKKPIAEPLTQEAVYAVYGGRWEFYKPLLHDTLMNALATSCWPKEPLFVSDFAVTDNPDSYVLGCTMYFVPSVVFPDEIRQIEVVGKQCFSEGRVEEEVRSLLLKLLSTKAVETEKKEDKADVGDVILCTIEAKIDGQPWGLGSLKNSRMHLVLDRVNPPELYEKLIGISKGVSKIVFVLSDRFGPLAGRTVEADVVVHGILSCELPQWTDDLAKEFGKPTYQDLRDGYYNSIKSNIENAREVDLGNEALAGLVEQVTFDPIPWKWLEMKGEERVHKHVSKHGDVKKACAAMGLRTASDLKGKCVDEARTESWYIMTLLAYGLREGVVREKDETLGNLSQYLRRVLQHLLATHTIVKEGPC